MADQTNNQITEYTRRDILDAILLENEPFHGKLDMIQFLKIVWPLDDMPSTDSRYRTMAEDVWKHMVANADWSVYELFCDKLDLLAMPDAQFLEFMKATVHPRTHKPAASIDHMVSLMNGRLVYDGYELFEARRVSNHPIYDVRRIVTPPTFAYDIALSFAGPDREYVRHVANLLLELTVTVFFDEYEEVDMWGKNLLDHLEEVYGQKARYCVMFVSRFYAERVWPNHERQIAQARALENRHEYILPVRFDDTKIPGLLSTIVYVDANHKSPEQLARMIIQKIGKPVAANPQFALSGVSGLTEEEHRFEQLVEDYENAGSFASARAASKALWDAEILSRLAEDQVRRILSAYVKNDQVRNEFHMVKFVLAVWKHTPLHTVKLKDDWIKVFLSLGTPQIATDENRLKIEIKRKFPNVVELSPP